MDPKHLETLAKTTFFHGIDIQEIPHVLDCLEFKTVDFKKNDYIVKVNEPFHGIFINLDGEPAVIKENISGNRIIINTFAVGDMFGEAIAFCSTETWPASIQALTDCTLIFGHPEKILNMCNRACTYHKIILANMIRVVAKKACELNRKVEYLMLKSIPGKLIKFLLEQKDKSGSLTFKLPLNRERLADYLNVSRPSMSRELCNLRDSGIIDFHRDLIRIKDEEKLKSLLEE